MNLQELRAYLDRIMVSLQGGDQQFLEARLESLVSVFPFNEYEYILAFLLDRGAISFQEYESLRSKYVSDNRYLGLFGLAPRIFGQVWGEAHLMDVDSRFSKPSRDTDPGYQGEYDLWFEGIKVEVKAARAINTRRRGDLVSKALYFESTDPFWMNFQQLKLDICDVFIFIGVWVDRIVYWVISNKEVQDNQFLSHQHRGGVEYQIGITHRNRSDFNMYMTDVNSLGEAVIAKARH